MVLINDNPVDSPLFFLKFMVQKSNSIQFRKIVTYLHMHTDTFRFWSVHFGYGYDEYCLENLNPTANINVRKIVIRVQDNGICQSNLPFESIPKL